ncbi:protein-nucleus import-related protein [Pseudozyma hubeiensis SY62]|uniref:Protein-nucleus import-related protein n=1 Tax=Pseudozyma hubeiensis (strain SY62) TaxID=1305764 RepID=R9PCN5_PSEHS|nr:protein-nucleus import-related protein [Pseudozyma hubeiensis SY62]GAC99124.1 protein-nucleus import-related protein [Pseudozyma hubeiensis SY62]
MEGTSYHEMAELLRQAALQEAASRAKTRSPLNTEPTASTSSSSKVTAEAEVEAEELFAVYEDEKAKNDALARTIDDRMEALANAKSSKADPVVQDEKRKLEIEWQHLEFAIRQLEEEKRHLPELDSSAVLDIRTRAELHDLNLQYSSALSSLRSDLASERDALSRETQLHSDLDIVSAGLSKRLAQLQRKRRQDLTSESSIRNSELNRKFKREEQRFKELLAQLIDMGTSLFGSDNRKVVTLRHYLDEFMNQAWDKPLDPWVSSTKLAMRRTGGEVDDAMIEFFVRANIIVPHPKDSRRWRLVGFHKPTRG